VGVTGSGKAVYKEDVTSTTPFPITGTLYGITYRPTGGYVAVGYYEDTATFQENTLYISSTNGVSWTAGTGPIQGRLTGITYGPPGGYVAVGYYGLDSLYLSSSNGQSWTGGIGPIQGALRGIAYGPTGGYVAIGEDAFASPTKTIYLRSPDGVAWTGGIGPIEGQLSGIAYGPAGGYVAVGYDNTSPSNNIYLSSPDGVTWTGGTMPIQGNLLGITYDIAGVYMAVGNDNSSPPNSIYLSSTDGVSWTGGTGPIEAYLSGITHDATNGYVAVGYDTNQNSIYLTSSDGQSWTGGTGPIQGVIRGIAYGPTGGYIGVGDDNNYSPITLYLSSPDGLSWTGSTGMGSTGTGIIKNTLTIDALIDNIGSTGAPGQVLTAGPTGSGLIWTSGGAGPTGDTGPQGNAGQQGYAGQQGNTGATGATGDIGPVGARGQPGATMVSGSGTPTGPANDGDFYLDTDTGIIYEYDAVSADTLINSVSGLEVWLDANDPLATGIAGTNGNSITTWYDKSVNQRDMAWTGGTGSSITYANNSINSLNSIYANGSNIVGNIDVPAGTFPSNYSGFIIFKSYPLSMSGTQMTLFGRIVGGSWASPFDMYSDQRFAGTIAQNRTFIGQTVNLDPFFISNTTSMWNFTFNNYSETGATGSYAEYFNGTAATFIQGENSGQRTGLNAQDTSTSINFGGRGGTPVRLRANICEILIYSSLLTLQQRQNIEGYLAWKWGLQSSLPANHPYYSSPFRSMGTWTAVMNLTSDTGPTGDTGPAGTQILANYGVPTGDIGGTRVNDFYIDLNTGMMYRRST
jgi:hypothetical protein